MARPRGRPKGSYKPLLLTDEVTAKICDLIKLAVPIHYAAPACGISHDTFQLWMEKGERGEEPYEDFFRKVTRARGEAVAALHVRALKGEKGSSAALWLLERRFWKDYAQHQRVELSTPDPLQIMPEDEVEAKLVEQRKLVARYERAKKLLEKG